MSRRPLSLKLTTMWDRRELYSETPTTGNVAYRVSIARGIPPRSWRHVVHSETVSRPHPARAAAGRVRRAR